jgi:apolipoprotein N-acyltransferase
MNRNSGLIAALQFAAGPTQKDRRSSLISGLFASTTESNRSYHEQLYYSTLRLFVATNFHHHHQKPTHQARFWWWWWVFVANTSWWWWD